MSSCIRLIKRDIDTSMRNRKYRFQLLIKDPKLLQPIDSLKRNYTFYFGKFALTALKYCSNSATSGNDIFNSLCNIPSTQSSDLAEVGVKSANTNFDLNSIERSLLL